MSEPKNTLSQNVFIIVLIIIVAISTVTVIFITAIYRSEEVIALDESEFPAIHVLVYNGCGFTGVANNVRSYISRNSLNINVVGIGNTRRFIYNESIIVVKHYDETDLRRLQNMTGIRNVAFALNENYMAPFIIIAGRDYQNFFYGGEN
jgi:hypothetical protein